MLKRFIVLTGEKTVVICGGGGDDMGEESWNEGMARCFGVTVVVANLRGVLCGVAWMRQFVSAV